MAEPPRIFRNRFQVALVVLGVFVLWVTTLQQRNAATKPIQPMEACRFQQTTDETKSNETNEATDVHDRTNVVVFLTNRRYHKAIAESVISLRQDGGYHGDVAIIVEEQGQFKSSNVQNQILKRNNNTSLVNMTFFRTADLWEAVADVGQQQLHSSYRQAPEVPECLSWHRKRGHSAYYLKTLIFHPAIASQWDNVLFLDGCMTFHSPHVHEIFNMKEIQGHILAAPDPWEYGERMLGGRVIPCADKSAVALAEKYAGRDLNISSYFTTGFVLYDSALVRNHGDSSSATLLELLKVYHELARVFEGDQLIMSVYWVYIRQVYQIIPYALFGSPRVPYEFIKRMPNEPYILTAGHVDRPVCRERPSSKSEIEGNHLTSKIKRSIDNESM